MGNHVKFRTRSTHPARRRECGRTLVVAITVVTLVHASILAGLWHELPTERGSSSVKHSSPLVEAVMLPPDKRIAARPPPKTKHTLSPLRQVSTPPLPPYPATLAANGAKDHHQPAISSYSETRTAAETISDPGFSASENVPTSESSAASTPDLASSEQANNAATETENTKPAAIFTSTDLLASSQLQYDVTGTSKGFSYAAHATINWQRDKARYAIEMKLHAFLFGSRTQASTGLVTEAGLQPDSFLDKARRERRLLFDWSQNVAFPDDRNSPISIPVHAQDRLSVFFQLAGKLASRKQNIAAARQEQWDIPVTGWNGVEVWTFAIQDIGQSELPYGILETWQVSRLPRPGKQNDQSVDVWYAPSLNFMPVRIRITQNNGDTVDQRLSHR